MIDKKNKLCKEKKGITLVALVITIIILLILSSIVLNYIFGENGILNMAQRASDKYEDAQNKEQVKLDELYSSMIIATNNNSQITVNIEDLKKIIQEEVDNKVAERVEMEVNNAMETINICHTGNIISQMGKTAPEGYLICDGSEYSISEYSKLANYFKEQFGNEQYFGGTGDKFKVPDLRGEFLKGASENKNVGIHVKEGLPEISGSFQVMANGSVSSAFGIVNTTGAFYRSTNLGIQRDGWTDKYNTNFAPAGQFSAARSNSIYGNSEHVTPNNTSVLYCIKY